MDDDILKIAQLAFVGGMVAVLGVVLWATVRWIKMRTEPSGSRAAGRLPIDDARLARIEQAVDTIAVEVERISEAQRFTAKVMAERLPERHVDRLPGSRAE